MKKHLPLFFSLFAISTAALCAQNPLSEEIDLSDFESETPLPTSDENIEKDIGKISKAFGHIIGQNLESLGLNFDLKQVITGIEECIKGETSPLTEAECIQSISLMQENAFQSQCDDNLKIAEEFLTKNSKEKDVIILEEGKLHYILLQKGNGTEVKDHDSPKIRYVGKFIDGKVFGESQEDEVISLDETILGFNKAIIGMQEGEKRRIFIHPEFGYGKAGFLPPNSLLTFEIEVVKANSPRSEEPAVSATSQLSGDTNTFDHHAEEIAISDTALEGVR